MTKREYWNLRLDIAWSFYYKERDAFDALNGLNLHVETLNTGYFDILEKKKREQYSKRYNKRYKD